MILQFWGARGSFAVSGPEYLEFGGATPCASLQADSRNFYLIDAGTGIRKCGEFLAAHLPGAKLTLFLTHFHLDHIVGLPSFQPLYDPRTLLVIYSSLKPEETRQQLDRLMGHLFFPVSFSETACQKEIRQFRDSFSLGPVTLKTVTLPHPQGNTGLRFEGEGGSVVFATDAEPSEAGWSEEIINWAAEADYLVADAMFTPEEYANGKKGWGHGTYEAAVNLAQQARCKHLVLSHWNPQHDDRRVKEIINRVRQKWPQAQGAKPGLKIEI